MSWLMQFTDEILSEIAMFAKGWAVAQLYCCGDLSFSKKLLSSRWLRSISIEMNHPKDLSSPRVLQLMPHLRSVRCESTKHAGYLELENCQSLINLPQSLESYTMSGRGLRTNFLTASGTSNPWLPLYPNLTTLCIDGPLSSATLREIMTVLPHNLVHLHLIPTFFHYSPPYRFSEGLLLPVTLETLKLPYISCPWSGEWLNRLPQLNTLELPISLVLEFNDSLPIFSPNLTRLDLKQRRPWSATNDFLLTTLPPSLTSLAISAPTDFLDFNSYEAFKKLLHLTITRQAKQETSLELLRSVLPRGLETLSWDVSVLEIPQSTIENLPKTLKSLNLGAGLLSSQFFALLPKQLTHLAADIETLESTDFPTSLTSISSPATALKILKPRPDQFTKIVALAESGPQPFFPISQLYKNQVNNFKLTYPNSEGEKPYLGIDGSMWSCLDHAFVLDYVELLEAILACGGREIWETVKKPEMFLFAVKNGSLKILEWYKKNEIVRYLKLRPTPRDLTAELTDPVLVALGNNRTDVAEWLTKVGFQQSKEARLEAQHGSI